MTSNGKVFKIEEVEVASLKPHPKNYRDHPDDQVEHLTSSLKQFGVYRNVVVARDSTILAGHGIVKAAKKLKIKRIPVIRMRFSSDDPRAYKVMIGDNEIEHLAEQNDRLLADLLKDLKKKDELLGTGFDEKMLAAFVMVTRPESEIASFDEAAQWMGMPEYIGERRADFIIVSFRNKANRMKFGRLLKVNLTPKTKSLWYPPEKRSDPISLRFVEKK